MLVENCKILLSKRETKQPNGAHYIGRGIRGSIGHARNETEGAVDTTKLWSVFFAAEFKDIFQVGAQITYHPVVQETTGAHLAVLSIADQLQCEVSHFLSYNMSVRLLNCTH